MRKLLSTKKTEIKFCEAVADIFHCASLAAEPLGHHPQIIAQLFIALFDVVSNFAALKFCDERVGDPPPSHPLPFLQLIYFAVQNIRLSHAVGPFLKTKF
jgi:hypothetical protein